MEINAQVANFMMTLAIGATLGFIFDFYRALRGSFHFNRLATMLMDGFYWLLALILTFACLLFSNWAQMRFYIFFGIFGGWLIYYKMLSALMVKFMLKILRGWIVIYLWLERVINFCFVRPLGYCWGIFLNPWYFSVRKFKRMLVLSKKK